MSTTLLASIRAQPWYPQVKAAMDQQKVPEYVWAGAIAAENPSAVGNATVMNTPVTDPPGFSYGMFQFHNDPNGIDPVYSGTKAANIMGPALASLGSSYTPRQALSAIEQAAWPGNDPKLIAKEDPQRVAAMQSIINQENALPAALQNAPGQPSGYAQFITNLTNGMGYNQVASGTSNAINSVVPSITSTVNNGISSLQTSLKGLAQQAFIGGIILAIIAGGFALLSSNDNDSSDNAPSRLKTFATTIRNNPEVA